MNCCNYKVWNAFNWEQTVFILCGDVYCLKKYFALFYFQQVCLDNVIADYRRKWQMHGTIVENDWFKVISCLIDEFSKLWKSIYWVDCWSTWPLILEKLWNVCGKQFYKKRFTSACCVTSPDTGKGLLTIYIYDYFWCFRCCLLCFFSAAFFNISLLWLRIKWKLYGNDNWLCLNIVLFLVLIIRHLMFFWCCWYGKCGLSKFIPVVGLLTSV